MRTLLKLGIVVAGVAAGVQVVRKYQLVEKGLVAAQELAAQGQVVADLAVVKVVSVADALLTKVNEVLSPGEPTEKVVGDEGTTPQNFSGATTGTRTGTGWPAPGDIQ